MVPTSGGKKAVEQHAARLKELESLMNLLTDSGVDARSVSIGSVKDETSYESHWGIMKKIIEKQKNDSNMLIIATCRAHLPDECLPWLDATITRYTKLEEKKQGFVSFEKKICNQLLGSGGNDGRHEFSKVFMGLVSDLLLNTDLAVSADLFYSASFGTITGGMIQGIVGQFDPGRAGGWNQGAGLEEKSPSINPWDYVLAIEGTLLFASVASRLYGNSGVEMSSPFAVSLSPAGFGSCRGEKSTNVTKTELWLPLWKNPASLVEIKHLFSEGRSSVGGNPAKTGADFCRALGTLGVDRGFESFERYIFLVRRGKAHAAVPTGRVPVSYNPGTELMQELEPLLGSLDRFLRQFKNVPASLASARHMIGEAQFSCALKPNSHTFIDLLRSLGRMEKMIGFRDRSKKPGLARPLSGLSPAWVPHCDDNGPEVRIAAALAAIQPVDGVGPLRSNLSGVDPEKPSFWADGKGRQCFHGSSLSERLAGVLARRLIDTERNRSDGCPMDSKIRISPYDVMSFLYGECNEIKLEELLWGFMLIDWRKRGLLKIQQKWTRPLTQTILSRMWCLLKLLHVPEPVRDSTIKREPRIAALLRAGHVRDACSLARLRLKTANIEPLDVYYEEKFDPYRLTASMLIPVNGQDHLEKLVLADKNENT